MVRRRISGPCVCVIVALAALAMLHLLAVALNPATGPWFLDLVGYGIERRLQRYANVVPYTATAASTGCVEVTLAVASVTFDLSTKACNGFACPSCFHVIAAKNEVYKLTLMKCSEMEMGGVKMGDAGVFANAVQMITIINGDSSKELVVVDGAGVQTRLRKNSAAVAACSTKSNNKLQFVSPSALSLERFFVAGRGDNTCPVGTSLVNTEAECRVVAAEGNRKWIAKHTDPAATKGCTEYIHTSAEHRIYFNAHATGAANALTAPVCAIDEGIYTP